MERYYLHEEDIVILDEYNEMDISDEKFERLKSRYDKRYSGNETSPVDNSTDE